MRATIPALVGAGVLAFSAMPRLAAARLPARQPVPAQTGPVVDRADVLDGATQEELARVCRQAQARDGGAAIHLQFLIVPRLGGEEIDAFSARVAKAWKLGAKGRENGVLVVWARDERLIRIEVGPALDHRFSPFQADRIIQDVMGRAFRDGRFGDGLLAGAREILKVIEGKPPSDDPPVDALRD